jgi:hypothetical protein
MRVAVGVFDTGAKVNDAVQELTSVGMSQGAFSVLGLRRVLAPALPQPSDLMRTRDLPFPANTELIAATTGPVADRLAAQLARKADTLAAALAHWLSPRHAAELQDSVTAGKLILFVQLIDNEDERRAYRSLLARSSNSVGVHDLVGD